MRLTIGKKLVASFLLIVALLGVVAYVGLQELSAVSALSEDLTTRVDEAIFQEAQLQASTEDMGRAVLGHLLNQAPTNKDDYDAAIARGDAAQAKLLALVTNPQGKKLLDRVVKARAAYIDNTRPLFAQTSFAGVDMKTFTKNTLRPLRQEMNQSLSDVISFQQGKVTQRRQAEQQAQSQARLVISIVAAAALVGAITVALLLARSFARPVAAVAAVTRRLAAGDLSTDAMQVRARDEIGDMARDMNGTVAILRQLISGLRQKAQQVMSTSEELSAVSAQAASAAQETARAMTHVAGGASEQALAAADVDRTTDELGQTIQQIANAAGQSAAEVQKAAQLQSRLVETVETVATDAGLAAAGANRIAETARSGAGVVLRTLTGMERIRETVGESVVQMKELEQASQQIGQITALISGIANQTNLLALNAAIEAARAGEHGRGFAVVADEVRTLAERSLRSAQEIEKLVQTIGERTTLAAASMQVGHDAVESNSRLATEAGQALQAIVTEVEKAAVDLTGMAQAAAKMREDAQQVVSTFDSLAAVTEENTAATEEMAASSNQMTHAMGRIAQVSRETAGAAEEVAASSEELTASAESVAASARTLAQIAQELETQMAQFKV